MGLMLILAFPTGTGLAWIASPRFCIGTSALAVKSAGEGLRSSNARLQQPDR